MDAAQTLRKLALFLAVALLCAGAAFAGTLQVGGSATPTINIQPLGFATASFQLVSADGSSTPFTVAVPSNAWFSVSPTSGTTAGSSGTTITILRDRAGAATGCLSGPCPDRTFTIAENGNAANTVTVTVHEGASGGGTSGLSASPATLPLTAANGFATSGTVLISTSNSTPVTVNVTANPSSWLSVFPSTQSISASNSGQFTVFASSASLSPDTTYNGTVSFSISGGSSLDVPVTFKVGSGSSTTGSIVVTPNVVSLSYPSGATSATVGVTSSSATTYNASSNSNWLLLNGVYSITQNVGTSFTVSLSAGSLATGTYQGVITVANAANSADFSQVTVNLSVNGASGGNTSTTVAPTTMNFYYQIGKTPPVCQTVAIGTSDTYNISATGRYVPTATSITGPNTFQVCPVVVQAPVGANAGSVTVTSATNGSSQTITGNLVVSDATAPVVMATVNNTLGDLVCTSQAGCSVPVTVFASDGSNLAITVAPSNSWITLSSTPTTTPATFTVTLNPAGLAGLNSGNITVTPTGAANASLVIPMILSLSGANTGGALTLSASSLSLGAIGSSVIVNVSANTVTNFTASTGTGCSWLSLSPSGSLTTTSTLTITALQAPASGQSNPCTISLATTSGTQFVTVSFPSGGGGGGGVTASTGTLNFSTQQGVNSAPQTVHLSGTSGTGFTVNVVQAGWLTVTPSSGTLGANGADLTVTAVPGSFPAGAYGPGSIIVSPSSGAAIQINANLTVTAAVTVSATPTSLSFAYQAGGSLPSSQSIAVTGAAANLPFSATVTSGAEWLSVNPTSGTVGTTATNLSVSVNPQSLAVNRTYTGTIVVAGTGTATGTTTINVTLAVSAPLPTITRVTNAASFNTGSVSAGEIITLFGSAMGPATLQSAPSGSFPTDLGGVQVTVGGYLAPILYVRNDQISVVVPYEINRPIFLATVPVIVRFLGQSSNGVNLTQAATAPGIFTTGNGTGQAAALNQNLSVNSAGNPVGKGEVVVLYLTGEGQTTPTGVTGKITNNATTFPVSGQVTVTIGGQPASVQFAGEAPGLISGVMQVNAVVPTSLTNTSVTDMPVVVSVGGVQSQLDARNQGAATIAVK
jgi:trimeric autotransporter adhesin